jgi:hypothetical protein
VLKSLVSLQCADVKYRVRVTNESPAESLQLNALDDSAFGNIATSATGQPKLGTDVLASTCQVPQTIAKGGYYECDFTARFCEGPSHTNKVTGTLSDNENGIIDQPSNTLTLTVGVSAVTP